MFLMCDVNIPANYKADLCYREGVVCKRESSRAVCYFGVLVVCRLLNYKDLVVCWYNAVKEGVICPLVYISVVVLDNYVPIYLGWVWVYLYLCPVPVPSIPFYSC